MPQYRTTAEALVGLLPNHQGAVLGAPHRARAPREIADQLPSVAGMLPPNKLANASVSRQGRPRIIQRQTKPYRPGVPTTMCGIGGVMWFSRAAGPCDENLLAALAGTMSHRGPDGAGMWFSNDRRVGFVHRRLSIIDLSSEAAQPMCDVSGQICVTYNGEIYNHAELRRELESRGHRFRTDHSDTEVLIEAYRQWGIDCLHRLRGMFAFALWDGHLRRLWLARDRIGIKPLYYALHGDRLIFGSEIRAILCDSDLPRSVDETAFFHYLSFLAVPQPRTMFTGIRKLAGGTILVIHSDGRVDERRYWDALEATCPVRGSDDELAERLGEQLRIAVRLRQVSDVPIGVFLSGGIDSSAIAALVSESEMGPLRTFTVGYDREYQSYTSELGHARAMAQRLGAEHHEIRLCDQDFLDFLPHMIELQDEPIADPVCMPLHAVAKLAQEHGIKVALAGEGSDELFWGYPNWRRLWKLQRLADRWHPPALLQRAGLAGLRLCGKEHSQPYEWLNRSARGLPVFWGGAEAYGEAEKSALLSPRLRAAFRGRSSWEAIAPIYARYRQLAEKRSTLTWMTYLDLNLRLPELLLMRVDKMTMGVGIETRVPFLDHEIVTLALGISEEAKTRGRVLKALLKRALRGLLPDQIIDRPKQGFGVPVREWLGRALNDDLRALIDRFVRETDLLDPATVNSMFAGEGSGERRWYVINMALWWDRFIRRPCHSEPIPMRPPVTASERM